MHICGVEFPEDLASFDLAQDYLFFDVVQYHQEVLALLGVSGVIVGHCDHSAVVLHDDGGQFERNLELLTEGDKEIELLCKCENGAGFGVGGRGCNGILMNTAVVKGANGPIERDIVSGVALAVRVEEIRSVDFAV